MLQRAASNAYSWWWSSHIRTKQTKWLEQSLQDMEDKVQSMLRLIEEDGDSFAKRAEMYYKRRPELISAVEEAYKSFRSLADRYDLLSKDLQTANHTIATVFPEQVQYMDDDNEAPSPKITKKSQTQSNMVKTPKVPPIKDFRSLVNTASKQLKGKKVLQKVEKSSRSVAKSGLSKEAALEEINKLNKDILALQTVKEFVKSSYESGLAKYWGIENQISEMQEKVSKLQDEFNVDTVIEDDDARTLMAETALKSCQDILTQLEEKQGNSEKEAEEEEKRIEAAREILDNLKTKYLETEDKSERATIDESQSGTTDVGDAATEPSQDKSKENLVSCSMTNLTVMQLAEKIDQLVDKVIGLETAVSSQTVLVSTLKTESDELHAKIWRLEDEKDTLVNEKQKLKERVRELEEKLAKIQKINKNVERQNSNLQTTLAEARSSLDHLSERVSTVKPDQEVEEINPLEEKLQENLNAEKDSNSYRRVVKSETYEKLNENLNAEKDSNSIKSVVKFETHDKLQENLNAEKDSNSYKSVVKSETHDKEEVKKVHVSEQKPLKKTVTFLDEKPKELNEKTKEAVHVDDSIDLVNAALLKEQGKNEDLNWQQMLLSGMEDREKILLKEYTTILRYYKDVKKKLSDLEKKERDSQFDIILKMRVQKKALLKRDKEIQQLRQRLNLDQDEDRSVNPETITISEEDEMEFTFVDGVQTESILEEKIRSDIDAILDENLDFWLRFSTTVHQIKKSKTEVHDLQEDILKIEEKKIQEGSVSAQSKSEIRPIYKHLREIQRELTIWLEQSVVLKEELKTRFNSLCNIQDDIAKALNEGENKFSSHQAAKFQGEIMNMKQENNKVREELQTGFDNVSLLQLEIEKTLRKLSEEFGVYSDQRELKHTMSRSKIPLRSFIFGKKVKKQRTSIFSRYHILKSAMPHSSR